MICVRTFVIHTLLIYLAVQCQQRNNYTITRVYKDIFKIPSTKCENEIEKQCNGMDGTQRTLKNGTKINCTCHCKTKFKNVFGFFDGNWKCKSNNELRNQAGCTSLKLHNEGINDIFIPLAKPQNNQANKRKIGYFKQSCTLGDQISYLNCNSKWIQLNQPSSYGFSLENDDGSLYHKGRNEFDKYNPKIYGYVVKLNLTCSQTAGKNTSHCVLLKVKGNRKCAIVTPTTESPSSIPNPSTKASTTTTSSTISLPTTTSQDQTSSTTTVHTEISTNKPTTANMSNGGFQPTTKEVITEISSSEPSASTNKTSPRKGASSSRDDNTGIIAGGIGGLVAIVTIIVVLIIIWRRRKRNSTTKEPATHREESAAANNYDQSAFNDPNDEEYSYAYTNNLPVVIKDHNGRAITGKDAPNKNNQASIYNSLGEPALTKTAGQSQSNVPSYNVLQRPENTWNTNQPPVYDVLEEPNSAINCTQDQEGPVYSTLEDPDYSTLEEPDYNTDTESAPVYNVLEEPNSTDAPDYAVLEGPDDEHVYGSLENQDPHLYGALDRPTSRPGQVMTSYNDVLYDTTGDVIESGDIYQALNQGGQRATDDVYQSLRHPMTSLDMGDMSEAGLQSQA